MRISICSARSRVGKGDDGQVAFTRNRRGSVGRRGQERLGLAPQLHRIGPAATDPSRRPSVGVAGRFGLRVGQKKPGPFAEEIGAAMDDVGARAAALVKWGCNTRSGRAATSRGEVAMWAASSEGTGVRNGGPIGPTVSGVSGSSFHAPSPAPKCAMASPTSTRVAPGARLRGAKKDQGAARCAGSPPGRSWRSVPRCARLRGAS